MQVVLTVVSGPRTGVRMRLREKSAITVGRSKSTDFHILDGTMSRVHAVVARDTQGWYVEDQKSRNGTWIDGQRIEKSYIGPGTVFVLGRDTSVRFDVDELGEMPDDSRSSASFGVLPPCAACGREVTSAADLTRSPDGKPYHLACRNLDHLVGQELGEFQVAEKLPALGDAFFFRAHQPSLHRNVMLEVYDPPLTSQPGYRQALLDEVRRASRFLHPNLLQIYSFEEARGMAIVVMEFFAGERLSTVLEQRRFVRIRGAVQCASQLLEALRYARDHGGALPWITTDVVLVSPDHTAKVKLFEDPRPGVAGRQMTAREASYVAPEILGTGGPMDVTGGADDPALVYSVGAILYHMLAGIPPFEAETAADVARRATTESPPALRRINLKVSPALATAVETAIQRERGKRYGSLEAFLTALRAAGA